MSRRGYEERVIGRRIEQVAYAGAERAIDELKKNIPEIEYLGKHNGLDERKILRGAAEIYQHVRGEGLHKAEKIVYQGIYHLVLNGEAFTEAAKKVILGKEKLRKKAEEPGVTKIFSRREARKELKEDEGIYKVIESFDGLYEFFAKNPDAVQHLPDVAQNLADLKKAGYLGIAAKILEENKMIDNKKKREIMGYVRNYVNESKAKVVDVVEERAKKLGGLEKEVQQIAASILGIFGAGFLASSFRSTMTGNVVGNGFGFLGGLGFVGLTLLFLAGIFFLSSFRKK